MKMLVHRDWDMLELKKQQRCGAVPFPSKIRGVYLLYDWDDSLQYVGVATYSFDKRMWRHDKHFESKGLDRGTIEVICFEADTSFLAPALEYYLISRLKPSLNTVS